MMKKIALLLSLAALLVGCAAPAKPADQSILQPPAQSQPPQLPLEPQAPTVSHLMVAGDVMSHMPLTKDAYVEQSGAYDYGHMLQFAAQQLAGGDYAVANLETVLAGGPTYSGYPTFHSPDGLASSIKQAGFDLLSTANNHSRDQGLKGLYRTLDVLDETGLAHVGTYRTQQERDQNRGIHVADVGGISVAFLAYTYGLNGFRLDSDNMYAASMFNLDYYTTLYTLDEALLTADLAAARELDTDLIAVIMHWGVEYKNAPNDYQQTVAEFLVGQGADLILGSHPHVLQPYQTLDAIGWDGQPRQGFVIYSLGNFLSNQQELERKTTVILDLELTRDPVTEETSVTDVRYTPYFMLHRDREPVGARRHLVDIHRAMEEYEGGTSTLIDQKSYAQLEQALAHCHQVMGAQGDRPSVA